MIRRRGDRNAARDERGQGLVEFSALVPAFMLLLLGMLEFGFLFDHTLTIRYASREGARVGSALANGGSTVACGDVDDLIIAAVQRVVKSPGSRLDFGTAALPTIPSIRIFKANSSGAEVGPVNIWTYSPGAGPTVDGQKLDYIESSVGWDACSVTRKNYDDASGPPESIGVSLVYTYRLETALGSVLRFFGGSGWSSITVSDRTVMAFNPTN